MIEKKNLYVANFNCTFSKDKNNEPLLSYFETIIFPAFTRGTVYKKPKSDNEFLFEEVELNFKNGVFVLMGLIVKKTHLEIKTRYDEQGVLTTTNDLVQSDPFSYFIINLQNHRMVLVQNQKGSPTVTDFDRTASHILSMYVREHNRNVSQNENRLPKPNLNVVTVPHSGKIEEELKNISKIESAVLRFYPLNGDISANELFNELREMLDKLDSKTGSTQFNNPQNHKEVTDILKDTKGTVRPTLRVVYDNGSRRTLRENDFSENTKIQLDESSSFHKNMSEISEKVVNHPHYNDTSVENAGIYQRYLSKLEIFFSKRKQEEK